MSFFGRKPSDPPVPPSPLAGDQKGLPPVAGVAGAVPAAVSDDLPLPDDIRLGDHSLRFNKQTGWQLMTEPSADHKRAIDTLQRRIDELLERQHLAQAQAAASNAAAADQKYSADGAAARRIADLERENQLLKWKNQVLLTCLTVRDLDYDAAVASIGDPQH